MCRPEQGDAAGSAVPSLSQQALAALVDKALKTPGIPEPPLRHEATRAEREAYLEATEPALELLAQIPRAKRDSPEKTSRLLLEDQSAQILAVSRMLAVELADAIDREDLIRAENAVKLAVGYADSVSQRSIPDWVGSGAVADSLSLGVQSVGNRLTDPMEVRLLETLRKLEEDGPNGELVRKSDAARVERWQTATAATTNPVPIESIPMIAGVDPDARVPNLEGLRAALADFAPEGTLEPTVLAAETLIASQHAIAYLQDPRGEVPAVDAARHPVAAFVMTLLNPTLRAASTLPQRRTENLRIVALTIRIANGSPPEALDLLGEIAWSPVSDMLFDYVQRENGFDLVRPRPKVDPTR